MAGSVFVWEGRQETATTRAARANIVPRAIPPQPVPSPEPAESTPDCEGGSCRLDDGVLKRLTAAGAELPLGLVPQAARRAELRITCLHAKTIALSSADLKLFFSYGVPALFQAGAPKPRSFYRVRQTGDCDFWFVAMM